MGYQLEIYFLENSTEYMQHHPWPTSVYTEGVEQRNTGYRSTPEKNNIFSDFFLMTYNIIIIYGYEVDDDDHDDDDCEDNNGDNDGDDDDGNNNVTMFERVMGSVLC